MLHELGHVIGAHDQPAGSPYHYDLMGGGWHLQDWINIGIPSRDVRIVEQLYRHFGGVSH